MTNLAHSNKDDYPAAAKKHLNDVEALMKAERFDGAGYLLGYVVECSLRSVVMIGEIARLGMVRPSTLAAELSPKSPLLTRFRKVAHEKARTEGRGHDLDSLAAAATGYAKVLNSANAPYAPPQTAAKQLDGAWTESIRYRAEGEVPEKRAKAWLEEASRTYLATVGEMMRNGVLRW